MIFLSAPPKIADFGFIMNIKQNVLWFQVSMNDFTGMKIIQSLQTFFKNPNFCYKRLFRFFEKIK